MKRIREQLVRYAKEKLNFKKNLRNTFLATVFLGATFSTLLGNKVYASTEGVTIEHQDETDLEVLENDETLNKSKVFFIGEKVYPVSGAKIYCDEYSLFHGDNAKKMRYSKDEKEITGMVFLVNDEPTVIINKDVASDYQTKYSLCGYLINGVEGFIRVDDVFGLEETIEEVVVPVEEDSVNLVPEMPLEEKVATPSIATPSMVATASEAKMATASTATPSMVATASEVKMATASTATPSMIATASEVTAIDGLENVYRINDQVSIMPTAKFYSSLKKMKQGKGAKAYPDLKFNKVTGIVVNGKIYHENDLEKLEINSDMVVEGYEINHVRYVDASYVYQKERISISDEEMASRSVGLYKDSVKLTSLPNAKIYESMIDMAISNNGKTPLYQNGTMKEIRGFVMRGGDEVFMVNDYDKVKEYLVLGYEFIGYRIINEHSKNANHIDYEGFFDKNKVVSYDEYLNLKATSSEATPSELATPSEANVLQNQSLRYIQARKEYLKQLQASLENQRNENTRKLTKAI